MTHVLIAAFFCSLGYFVASTLITRSLADDIERLDDERQELDDDRRALLEFTRAQIDTERQATWDLGGHKRLPACSLDPHPRLAGHRRGRRAPPPPARRQPRDLARRRRREAQALRADPTPSQVQGQEASPCLCTVGIPVEIFQSVESCAP